MDEVLLLDAEQLVRLFGALRSVRKLPQRLRSMSNVANSRTVKAQLS